MNSEPNDEDSTLVCFLLNQCISAQFKYTKKPVLDRLVTVLQDSHQDRGEGAAAPTGKSNPVKAQKMER